MNATQRAALSAITPTRFDYATIDRTSQARFTVYDLLPILPHRTPTNVTDAILSIWADDPEAMPPVIEITIERRHAPMVVKTHVLNWVQVFWVLGRMNGKSGCKARATFEHYIEALNTLIHEKAIAKCVARNQCQAVH